MKVAGLTGGIATGKSTVADMFEELGASIVDSDAIAHRIVEPGEPAYKEIVEYFGKGILRPDRTIDREELGAIVFNDDKQREMLNRMTHPRVFERMRQMIEMYGERGAELVLCDIPLLIESGAQKWINPVILVYADPEIQMERLVERDKCSKERAASRISSQMPIDDKKKLADLVIDNSDSIESTREQVRSIWKKLLE